MTMKTKLVFALAAVLAAAPLLAAPAAKDEKKDAAAEQTDGPTPEQLKARKAKKPSYTKFADAKAAAEKCGLPLMVAALPELSGPAAMGINALKQKVLGNKDFMKDFAAQNCVFAFMKIKPDSKNPKVVDTKSLKEPELKFIENFAVNKQMIAKAKQQKQDEPKYTDMKCYPAIICMDSACEKELFRLASYDKDGGFGVWLSQVVDMFRSAGIEPVLSPRVTKIVENPDEPKKWK